MFNVVVARLRAFAASPRSHEREKDRFPPRREFTPKRVVKIAKSAGVTIFILAEGRPMGTEADRRVSPTPFFWFDPV